jgi:hypothetical protein
MGSQSTKAHGGENTSKAENSINFLNSGSSINSQVRVATKPQDNMCNKIQISFLIILNPFFIII